MRGRCENKLRNNEIEINDGIMDEEGEAKGSDAVSTKKQRNKEK